MHLCGLLLLLAAASGMGLWSSARLNRQAKTLEEVLQMLMLMKGEIRYGNVTLKEACTDVSERSEGVCQTFLEELAQNIPCQDFGGWFARCAISHLKPAGLEEKQLEPLYLLGNRLGYLDNSMQVRQLELCEERLTQMLTELKRELPQKQKLHRSLGILGGLLLVLLLW